MWKKKILMCLLFAFMLTTLVACGKNDIKLSDYVVEKRENLFIANDDLYSITFSTGVREKNYNFDGIIDEMVPFSVITLTRNDNLPLANDTYAYIVTIGEETYSGFLEKTNINSYSADLEINVNDDALINAQVSFTGYVFNKDLENISASFQVDSDSALTLAQSELKDSINNIISDNNVKFEVVMKTMKDHSNSEIKNYYWYIGVISTNGETLGILVDANSGDIIAKKA